MKLVILPLDERPCNLYYPKILPLDSDIKIVTPPSELLSVGKKVCDISKLNDWLLDACKDADYAVIALDTLCYGGIVPSRLHHDKYEDIIKRSNVIREIKKINPNIHIFANELIMRCPAYSIAVEEPDYFDECGLEIFLNGWYTDKEAKGKLSEEEKELMKVNRSKIKEEYLDDFISRRQINREVTMYNLSLVKEGIVEFFSIPQDDCSEFGYSTVDRRFIEAYII